MKDINYIAKVLQQENIQLHPKDEISMKLWLSELKQKGAKTFCKDKLDPPPLGSRLARDLFILVIQTEFQSDAFWRLGNSIASIDATHNTTYYSGLQCYDRGKDSS